MSPLAQREDAAAQRRAELEAALGPRAVLVRRQLALHEHDIELWSVNDVDPLLAELEELEHTDPVAAIERLPYWASLWPSSIALATFVLEREHELCAMNVLELGCGAGLASVAARIAGARVVSTDLLEAALQLSELNFLANGFDDFDGRLVDWRCPAADLRADVVLCADVAYERETLVALADTLELVCEPRGRVLLAEPRRPVAKTLFALLADRGWKRSSDEVSAQLDARLVPVDVHTFTR